MWVTAGASLDRYFIYNASSSQSYASAVDSWHVEDLSAPSPAGWQFFERNGVLRTLVMLANT